jgi:pimeloyl-ACP methyl ester carboxylesterase
VDRDVFSGIMDGISNDRPGFLAGFGKHFYGAGLLNFAVGSDLLAWSQGLAMLASPRATLQCVRAFSETDFRADLAKFTIPTLIIHGDADATVPLSVSAEKAAALVPHAELKVYGGAPHGLFYTERDRLNADLLTFLQG